MSALNVFLQLSRFLLNLSHQSATVFRRSVSQLGSHADFERNYWGNCCNTFDEEQKHFVYAHFMGLEIKHYKFVTPKFRILDVGGGPASMLLKVADLSAGLVVDPMAYPRWTVDRYAMKNIHVKVQAAEEMDECGWDEVWLYNCLQHTIDPYKIVSNCMRAGKKFRVFEWLDVPPHEGHPWMLTEESMNKWIGSPGKTVMLNDVKGCTGKAYYGVFDGMPK